MIQTIHLCSKCSKEIETGREIFLQLIDRNNMLYDNNAVRPAIKWEYCLCQNCFNDFNNSVRYPYQG